jgi:hypothetical protein
MRAWPEERHVAQVPATKVNETVTTTDGRDAEVRDLADSLPRQAGKRVSAGAGVRGQRLYGWARTAIRPLREDGFGHGVPARRGISDPTEISCHVC